MVPDISNAFYTLTAGNSSLDLHLSYLGGVIQVNFKYLPKAPLTHRYSVRLASGVLWPGGQVEEDTNYVIRYYSAIKNGKKFVTESNGLELIQRTFGEKTTIVDENYYPITRFISLQDNRKRMTVIVDRAAGGTGPEEGVLEVMFNRRSSRDDLKGAEEGLFEPETSNVLHYLTFDTLGEDDQQLHRVHQVESDNPPLVYQMLSSRDNQTKGFFLEMSDYGREGVPGVEQSLVRVLFDRRANGRLMVRLYNMDDLNSVSLDLRRLLQKNYSISPKTLTETGIDFNFKTKDMNAWDYLWNKRKFPEWNEGEILIMKPLQIRTFEVTV